jgi:hypothetical protein
MVTTILRNNAMGKRSKTVRGTVYYVDSAQRAGQTPFTVEFIEEAPAVHITIIITVAGKKKPLMQVSWPKRELPNADDATLSSGA